MRIAIYARPNNSHVVKSTLILLEKLEQIGRQWVMYEPLYHYMKAQIKCANDGETFKYPTDIQADNVELIVSVGGDGTLLDTVTFVKSSGIPIIGINSGRLGFLANVDIEHINEAVEYIMKGHFTIDKRALLKLESNADLFGDNNFALNELTIHKQDSSSMITIHTYMNGEYLNSYWADGLIVSTPTGSTGYSLSCGGPIMVPQSESFVITPIAPHNLNVRPIIVPDKNVISFEIEGRSKHFMVSLDSRSAIIDASTQLAIRKEDFEINLVRLNNQNFMDTLRNKLMWGIDSRN